MRLENHMSYPAPSRDHPIRLVSVGSSSGGEDLLRSGAAASGWGRRVWCFVVAGWERFRKEIRIQATIKLLESFDDRTLGDIGIHRCLIEHMVRREPDDE
jgi:uncharacterized protein YjiS (DUF1127 family)